ncbi:MULTISPECIES: DUF4124 domain-containing protein [Methylomonas]|uniref:DUF4124 domain-containing protein n=1 Tax=Methylomonas koyamae TaxID=702114 RepID=A0A177N487_9GAMM|nr:DUF4124 domain-containing protein [Methylomonas koyamae]OAI11950.1 hypothetical protein A1355_14965 [Methylomonas koyamae]
MRLAWLLLGLCGLASAQAEVFKCSGKSGKTVYQQKPCSQEGGRQLDIHADPAREAEAKAKLEALREENQVRKAARLEAEKQQAERQRQIEEVEAMKRSALAQQQQADAQRRQAEALERRNSYIGAPVIYAPVAPMPGIPGLPGLGGSPGYSGDQHHHEHERRPGEAPNQPVDDVDAKSSAERRGKVGGR